MTPETRDEMTDFGARFAPALPRVDHEIGAAALFPVAHLCGEDRRELFMAHPRPREHAAALHVRGRRHHNGRVDMRMTAAFEKEGNIERDDRRALIDELCQNGSCELVQVIGKMALVYRRNSKPNRNLSNISRFSGL